jgi:hypothetical protein
METNMAEKIYRINEKILKVTDGKLPITKLLDEFEKIAKQFSSQLQTEFDTLKRNIASITEYQFTTNEINQILLPFLNKLRPVNTNEYNDDDLDYITDTIDIEITFEEEVKPAPILSRYETCAPIAKLTKSIIKETDIDDTIASEYDIKSTIDSLNTKSPLSTFVGFLFQQPTDALNGYDTTVYHFEQPITLNNYLKHTNRPLFTTFRKSIFVESIITDNTYNYHDKLDDTPRSRYIGLYTNLYNYLNLVIKNVKPPTTTTPQTEIIPIFKQIIQLYMNQPIIRKISSLPVDYFKQLFATNAFSIKGNKTINISSYILYFIIDMLFVDITDLYDVIESQHKNHTWKTTTNNLNKILKDTMRITDTDTRGIYTSNLINLICNEHTTNKFCTILDIIYAYEQYNKSVPEGTGTDDAVNHQKQLFKTWIERFICRNKYYIYVLQHVVLCHILHLTDNTSIYYGNELYTIQHLSVETDIKSLVYRVDKQVSDYVSTMVLTYVKLRCNKSPSEQLGYLWNERFNIYIDRREVNERLLSNNMIVKYSNHPFAFYKENLKIYKESYSQYIDSVRDIVSDIKVLGMEERFGDYMKFPDQNVSDPPINYTDTYYFGEFTNIYDYTRSNSSVAEDMTKIKEKIIESGKSVLLIGYGASGAGKTTSLVYNNKGATDDERNGVLIHLAGQIIRETKGNDKITITQVQVNIYEFYENNFTKGQPTDTAGPGGNTTVRDYSKKNDTGNTKPPESYGDVIYNYDDEKKNLILRGDTDIVKNTHTKRVENIMYDMIGNTNYHTEFIGYDDNDELYNKYNGHKNVQNKLIPIPQSGLSVTSKKDNDNFIDLSPQPTKYVKQTYKQDDKNIFSFYLVPGETPDKTQTYTKFYAGSGIAHFMIHAIDNDRFVKATENNPNSSRSHSLIFLKFMTDSKAVVKKEYGRLIVGDFAGVENEFACGTDATINKLAKVRRDFGDRYTPFYKDPYLALRESKGIEIKDKSEYDEGDISGSDFLQEDNINGQPVTNDGRDMFEFISFEDTISKEKRNIFEVNYKDRKSPNDVIVNIDEVNKVCKAIFGNSYTEIKENDTKYTIYSDILKKFVKHVGPENLNIENLKNVIEKYNPFNKSNMSILDTIKTMNTTENPLGYDNLTKLYTNNNNLDIGGFKPESRPLNTHLTKFKLTSEIVNIDSYTGNSGLRNLINSYENNSNKPTRTCNYNITDIVDVRVDMSLNDIDALNKINEFIGILNSTQFKNGMYDSRTSFKTSYGNYIQKNLQLFGEYAMNKPKSKKPIGIEVLYVSNNKPYLENLNNKIKEIKNKYVGQTQNIIANKCIAFEDAINNSIAVYIDIDTFYLIPKSYQLEGQIPEGIQYILKSIKYDNDNKPLYQQYYLNFSDYISNKTTNLFNGDGRTDPSLQDVKDDIAAFKSHNYAIFKRIAEFFITKLKQNENKKKYIKKICEARRNEGYMINKSLETVRRTFSYLLKKRTENSILINPPHFEECDDQYTNEEGNLFKFTENGEKGIVGEIFKTIKKESVDVEQLILSVFCVLNVSRDANNPPPIPYVDLSVLRESYKKNYAKKSINEYVKYNNNVITDDNFKNLINDALYTCYLYHLLNKSEIGLMVQYSLNDGISTKLSIIDYLKKVLTNSDNIMETFIDVFGNIESLINHIDNINQISSIGTLEFVDRLSKLNTVNTLCRTEPSPTNIHSYTTLQNYTNTYNEFQMDTRLNKKDLFVEKKSVSSGGRNRSPKSSPKRLMTGGKFYSSFRRRSLYKKRKD